MPEQISLLEKMVFAEFESKNRAIHAYDGITWKIRSGFVTLLFGGWAILLNGIVESTTPPSHQLLAWGLFLFTLGCAFGAWYVDRSYVRRKFRVILALDSLTDEIKSCAGDYQKIPSSLLKVAGDNADMPYEGKSYREASKAEFRIYIVPLLVLAIVIHLVVK